MKKIRYLPFGYTIRNGHTVIEQQEADIVRNIFKAYIQGASLKEIAEDLTAKQIPYTERTCVWDKARISRILENAKYTGDEEFEMIIDEDIYEEAAAVKSARALESGGPGKRRHPADPRPCPLRTMRCADAPAHQFQTCNPGKLDMQQCRLWHSGAGQRRRAAPENHAPYEPRHRKCRSHASSSESEAQGFRCGAEFAAADLRRNGAGASK